jgi:hypothetical protein
MTQQIKTTKLYQFPEQGILPEELAAPFGALKSLMEAYASDRTSGSKKKAVRDPFR